LLISIHNQNLIIMKKFIEDHAIRLDSDHATIHYKGYEYKFKILVGKYVLTDYSTGAHLIINRPTQLDRLQSFGSKLYNTTADVAVYVNGEYTHSNTFESLTTDPHCGGGVWVTDMSDQYQEKRIERTFFESEEIK